MESTGPRINRLLAYGKSMHGDDEFVNYVTIHFFKFVVHCFLPFVSHIPIPTGFDQPKTIFVISFAWTIEFSNSVEGFKDFSEHASDLSDRHI